MIDFKTLINIAFWAFCKMCKAVYQKKKIWKTFGGKIKVCVFHIERENPKIIECFWQPTLVPPGYLKPELLANISQPFALSEF